jgi:hypothetical protein
MGYSEAQRCTALCNEVKSGLECSGQACEDRL